MSQDARRQCKRCEGYEAAIRWALGEEGRFQPPPYATARLWWRSKLRALAGMVYDSNKAHSVHRDELQPPVIATGNPVPPKSRWYERAAREGDRTETPPCYLEPEVDDRGELIAGERHAGRWHPADRDGGKDPVDLFGTCPLVREAKRESEIASVEAMVLAFHEKYGAPVASSPTLPGLDRQILREKMIREEAQEFVDAHAIGDLVEIADALADLVYVAVGTAIEYGIPFMDVFREVHRSNMTKTKGVERDDGKILKGPSFEPPNIKAILQERP